MKHNRNALSLSIRLALGAGMVAGLAMTATHGFAQEEAEEIAETVDRIQVTGTRLDRVNYDAVSPVTVLDRDQIERSEFATLGDILAQLPQLGSTFTSQNSSRFIGTAGLGLLDLRGLGTNRTLVLVNGRRHVAAQFSGSQAMDVNSIPAEMIERVEVVTGANSAVSGADAVAGAVNFILRDTIEGTSLNASYGFAEDVTSFDRRNVGLTHGARFGNGRGSAIFSLQYSDQSQLTNLQRGGQFVDDWGFTPNPNAPGADPETGIEGSADEPVFLLQPFNRFWALSFGGTANIPGAGWVRLDDNGNPVSVPFGDFDFIDGVTCAGPGCEGMTSVGSPFNILQVPLKRWSADANFKIDLNENHNLYFENRLVRVSASDQFQPSFDFFSDLAVFRDNAFMNADLGALMDAGGVGAIGLQRMHRDLGMRIEESDRTTFRHVAGIEGAFDGPNNSTWEYDAYANFGRLEGTRKNNNNRNNDRFYAAADAIALSEGDVEALTAAGANSALFPGGAFAAGDIVCRSTLQGALGETPILMNGRPANNAVFNQCVPANVLGENISPEAAAWINSTAIAKVKRDQFQTGGMIRNSDWLSNWAGDIPFVVGAEFRRERIDVTEDSLAADPGATFFNALGEVVADFDVTEAFGEFAFPLLRNAPGVRDLTFEGAARYSDYSTIGSTFTWETRLSYTPIDQVTFRATRGDAIRAPNLGELFDPPSQNFANINHPCDQDNLVNADDRDTRIANCRALGIPDPENFDARDEASIELLSGGNPNLAEETARTFTVGLVWSPEWVNGLDLSIDYWDIEINEAIAATGAQTILNRCVDDSGGIDNQFCGLVDFAADGNIDLARTAPVNLNDLLTSGYDVSASYRRDVGPGVLRTNLVASYLSERTFVLNTADDVDILAGQLGNPRWRANMDASWRTAAWELFGRVRWISSQHLVRRQTRDNQPFFRSPENMMSGSVYYLDLGVGYETDFGLRGRLSVNNAFDRGLPFLNTAGTGAGSGLFDNVGRFYSFDLGYTF